ncbi:MAG: trypsin-like peptidase domain-containing protein [Anaerolineales bacterium]|jgi:2-alkenal reductase
MTTKRLFPLFLLITIFFGVGIACQTSFDLNQFAQPTAGVSTPQIIFLTPAPLPTSAAPPVVIGDLRQQEDLLAALYERVSPGVVAIQTLSDVGGGLGSGFVYDHEGHIVTNYHVVENATDLEVDFISGLKVRGEVIANDLDSDLAVIKVDVPADQLKPLVLGDSDALKVGQMVVAIGNPFGLSSTMTLGIVSAKGRTLESIRTAPEGGSFSAGDVIQTDAAINPGNSGGPLLNLNGEVIGLNRAIRATGTTLTGEPVNSGIGFAVSSNIIRRVVPVLITQGKYDYPYMGVRAREEISLIEQEALGLPTAIGAYVVEVTRGGPADKAGLKGGSRQTSIPGLLAGGDLIIAVDGQPVRVFGDLLSYLMKYKSPGDTIVLTILRNGEKKEITLTLDKRP